MAQYSLNEVLKAKAAREQGQKQDDGEIKLDDVTRVKVLSPTRKVFKRFKKNRLAMFGAYLLITMFVFSFIGPLFYAWGQTDIFYKNEPMYQPYAMIKETTTFSALDISGAIDNNNKTHLMMNSYIKTMSEGNFDKMITFGKDIDSKDSNTYLVEKYNDYLYTLSVASVTKICDAGTVESKIGVFNDIGRGDFVAEGEEIPGLGDAIRKAIKEEGEESGSFEMAGSTINYRKLSGKTYNVYQIKDGFEYYTAEPGAAFESAVSEAIESGNVTIEAGGKQYVGVKQKDGDREYYTFYSVDNAETARAYTTLSAHLIHLGAGVPNAVRESVIHAVLEDQTEFKMEHINFHIVTGETTPETEPVEEGEEPAADTEAPADTAAEEEDNGVIVETHEVEEENEDIFQVLDENDAVIATERAFEYNGEQYTVEERDGEFFVLNSKGEDVTSDVRSYTVEEYEKGYRVYDDQGEMFAELTNYSVKRSNGEDSIEFEMKEKFIAAVEEMQESGQKETTIRGDIPQQDDKGAYVYDENGRLQYKEDDVDITSEKTGEYVARCWMVSHLIDRFASPSLNHLFGTDGDGFDVLSRIMYGGRISLLVGFVVVILEIFLGIIMGGLAGYYGKWVDMLVMRLVDIFYCLPSMPILIIIGAAMDASRANPYIRLLVMIASLGIMGWAGVARMVRGQILSLREQEFMVAAEATGIKVSSRIFRHLIPNVMPQLIVIATMGMGGVILTESTLSYLGLGVKHPLATWGSMINSVSTATAMKYYPYIWIPVGILICLTVIAFNFVGDGLRDAYDPKSNK